MSEEAAADRPAPDGGAGEPAADPDRPTDHRASSGRSAPARRNPARSLGLVCAGLAGAAALLWGASVAVWYTVTPPGRALIELTGAEVSAVPGASALLALAGVAAAVATRGPLRRAIGALLAVAGGAAAAVGVRGLLAHPFAVDVPASGLPQLPPGTPVELVRGQPVELTAAPLLVLAGAALLLAAGLFVLLAEPRLAHLGARYGTRRERRAEPDPDRAAWLELDAGRDPTLGPGPPRRGRS